MSSGRAKSAVYAGTFDPITYGHCDIVERALKIFDLVYVAVTADQKPTGFFQVTQRVELVKKALEAHGDRVIVSSFSGLLVDYVRRLDQRVIVRGLRAVSDYDYEAQMAMTNRRLADDIETMFLMTSWQYSFVSSSIVREVARNGGDVSSLVPPCVEECVRGRFVIIDRK